MVDNLVVAPAGGTPTLTPNRNTNGDTHSDSNHNAKSNAYTHYNCNADEYAYIDDDTHPDADFDSMHGKVCTHSAPAPHARPSSLTVK